MVDVKIVELETSIEGVATVVVLVETAAEEAEDEVATEIKPLEVSVLVMIPDDVLDMVVDAIGVTGEDGPADAVTT